MTNIEQFESIFSAASHEVFQTRAVELSKVLVVTDLDEEGAQKFQEHCQKLLSVIEGATWIHLHGGDWNGCDEMIAKMRELDPDLICSYRNLKSKAFRYPYSLGVHLNVLLRQIEPPVVVLPHPSTDQRYAWAGINTDRVLAVTDHLTGDDELVSWAAQFCEPGGKLFLAHIEDEKDFERYMAIIGKLPDIPTEMAREQIGERLLKEPTDYIRTCAAGLKKAGHELEVVPVVKFGHRVEDFRSLIEENECDLLVCRTRAPENEQAMALKGAAYSLALEVRKVPLLML